MRAPRSDARRCDRSLSAFSLSDGRVDGPPPSGRPPSGIPAHMDIMHESPVMHALTPASAAAHGRAAGLARRAARAAGSGRSPLVFRPAHRTRSSTCPCRWCRSKVWPEAPHVPQACSAGATMQLSAVMHASAPPLASPRSAHPSRRQAWPPRSPRQAPHAPGGPRAAVPPAAPKPPACSVPAVALPAANLAQAPHVVHWPGPPPPTRSRARWCTPSVPRSRAGRRRRKPSTFRRRRRPGRRTQSRSGNPPPPQQAWPAPPQFWQVPVDPKPLGRSQPSPVLQPLPLQQGWPTPPQAVHCWAPASTATHTSDVPHCPSPGSRPDPRRRRRRTSRGAPGAAGRAV